MYWKHHSVLCFEGEPPLGNWWAGSGVGPWPSPRGWAALVSWVEDGLVEIWLASGCSSWTGSSSLLQAKVGWRCDKLERHGDYVCCVSCDFFEALVAIFVPIVLSWLTLKFLKPVTFIRLALRSPKIRLLLSALHCVCTNLRGVEHVLCVKTEWLLLRANVVIWMLPCP